MTTMEKDRYFKNSYEEARIAFRGHLAKIKENWPKAVLTSHKIGEEQDNTVDMIYSEALTDNRQVLFFTSGEHGIEGYAGAAVIHLFVDEYLDSIDPDTTGICMIHALNPWGMRHFRRVTENNVDLNRNYLYDPDTVPKDVNQTYAQEKELFLPNGKIMDVKEEKATLYARLAEGAAKASYSAMKEAKGMGQFKFERGVYYGGSKEEESTCFLKSIQRKLLSAYQRVIHMDWHTALGPTNEVTMLVSELDPRNEEELKSLFPLENIQTFTPEKVKGDSTNHFHKLKNEEYPETHLFSALFEFGTFGEGIKAELREFTTIILENHLYWEGAEKEEDIRWIRSEFQKMFYPEDEEWRQSVLNEARLAMKAVLKAEKIMN
ncbi:M14 family metallopeptidase [Bacillus tianshenii]|nr:M14 family metallopeptidase [Bacillus tianshenii]